MYMYIYVYVCERVHTHTHTHTHTQCPQMTDDNIHWFSIVNSIVILVFLTGIVALIMLRILRKVYAYTINACMYTLAYAYTRMPRCHHYALPPPQGICVYHQRVHVCAYTTTRACIPWRFVYAYAIVALIMLRILRKEYMHALMVYAHACTRLQ